MPKPFAWSFSALDRFLTCPRQLKAINIDKQFSDDNSANVEGKRLHDAFDRAAKDGGELPEEYKDYRFFLDAVRRLPGKHSSELKLALDANFNPVDWFGNAWMRGIADYLAVDDTKATVVDWKTGKPRPKETQIEIMALLIFAHYPSVEQVKAMLIWLNHPDSPTIRKYKREDVRALWQRILPDVARMHSAYESGSYPATPNGLCKAWCAVSTCEFHGRGARG